LTRSWNSLTTASYAAPTDFFRARICEILAPLLPEAIATDSGSTELAA
jgi:hypothetical protein